MIVIALAYRAFIGVGGFGGVQNTGWECMMRCVTYFNIRVPSLIIPVSCFS